jgi:hypothetical protein
MAVMRDMKLGSLFRIRPACFCSMINPKKLSLTLKMGVNQLWIRLFFQVGSYAENHVNYVEKIDTNSNSK